MAFRETSPPEDFVLPPEYAHIHLREIKHSSRRKIALHLNLDVVLNDDIGYEPNYRGLAELAQFSTLEIRNFELPGVKSPTEELLDQWAMRDDLSPTVGNLWKYLKDLQRYDVLDDIWSFIGKLTFFFHGFYSMCTDEWKFETESCFSDLTFIMMGCI